jgi:hypothetical protein
VAFDHRISGGRGSLNLELINSLRSGPNGSIPDQRILGKLRRLDNERQNLPLYLERSNIAHTANVGLDKAV